MSDTGALQDLPPSTDMIYTRNSSNTPGLPSSSSALFSHPDSPDPVQEISYIPSDSANSSPIQNRKNDHSQPNGTLPKRPCGPCYTREELFHLKKSPLVAPPAGMPARKDWFGEYNEQANKPKDHDGLAASRISRHRRDDPEDSTRPFDSTRSSFKSGPPQPSQMGSFRLRDRGDDKDTASLKSVAERYDRGERLPSTMAGLTSRVKDRDPTQHFNSVTPRIGAVPRRTEGREPRQRKLGDEAGDWRKNADPARERAETRGESTRERREREASRSRGGDDNVSERRRRDRSRDDEARRWREEGTTGATRSDKERRGRDPSSAREDKETNGRGKKRDDEERAEANRRRKEERDKETPAWFDDDEVPMGGAAKGIVGAKVGDEPDELQKWKLEKRAREEQKEREEREPTMPSQQDVPNSETNYHESTGPSNLDEHKTPKPSNVQPDLLPAAIPPPLPTQGGTEAPSPLEQLKVLMGMQKADGAGQPMSGMFGDVSPNPASGNSSNGPTAFSNIVSRPPQMSSAINYDAMAKVSSDEARRPIDFDPPAVSRHAFAQPRNNPSPSPTDTGFGHNNKYTDPPAPQNGYTSMAGPPGLRPLQSSEPSRRTRNLSDMHAMAAGQLQQQQRTSQNTSPANSLGGGSDRIGFMNRQPPPHMNGGFDNATPLLHLPLSAGAGAGPREGSGNVLSVAAPQPQQSAVNMAGPMVGMGGTPAGVPHRGQNGSPQQNLLARLGILSNQQERKASPKIMDGPVGGFDRPGVPNELRMPMPQQHYGTGPPSALNRGAYGSPVDDRFEPLSATISNDGRFPLNQGQNGSAASSNFGPSPVGGNNPAQNLSAKGSRLAKFFENSRGAGEDMISPASMHSSGMGSMDGSMSGRGGVVTPPYQQFENNNKNQVLPDLLALLQGSNLHGSQPQNGMSNAQQSIYREEMAMRRQRELALQQQQQLREARLEQQMYTQNPDLYDRGGSFVANDLVPGLRPPIQRSERDLYNSERLDERLAYAAQGRIPGVPGNYDQMMRNMNVNPPVRGPNMYPAQGAGGGGGMSGHLAAEMLQQQQHQQQQRERQRQLLQRQEIERAQSQFLAMQGNSMGVRNPANNLPAQLGPRQNSIDQYSRAGRIPVNDIQSQQFGGYGGLGGGPGGMNGNGAYGGVNPGNNQLNGFDISMRQQQLGLQQQRQANLGMGYGGIGGVEPRYAQQNQMHGGGMHSQGGSQSSDLMALLLAGNHGNQQN